MIALTKKNRKMQTNKSSIVCWSHLTSMFWENTIEKPVTDRSSPGWTRNCLIVFFPLSLSTFLINYYRYYHKKETMGASADDFEKFRFRDNNNRDLCTESYIQKINIDRRRIRNVKYSNMYTLTLFVLIRHYSDESKILCICSINESSNGTVYSYTPIGVSCLFNGCHGQPRTCPIWGKWMVSRILHLVKFTYNCLNTIRTNSILNKCIISIVIFDKLTIHM